ncbi:MAG: MFS transporter [Bacillota bacterium]
MERLLGFSPSMLDRQTRRNFNLDASSALFVGVFSAIINPFVQVVAIRLGASNTAIGLIAAAPYLGAVASFYWGQVSHGRAQLPFVIWPNLVGRLILLLVAFTRAPWVYAIIILLYNFVVAVPGPAYGGLMQKIYPAAYRGRLLAAIRVFMGLSFAAVSYFAGKALDQFGHKVLFPVGVAFGVTSILIFGRVTEPAAAVEPGRPPEERPISFMAILRTDRLFLTYLAGFLIFGAANLFVLPLYPVFQVRVLHLSYTQVALLSLAWAVAWLFGYRVWGLVADRARPSIVLIGSVLGYGLAPLVYSQAHGIRPLLLASALIGLADAGLDIGWLAEVMRLAGHRTATYIGIHLTLMGIRGVIAPFVGTALLAVVPVRPLLVAGGIGILVGLIPFLIAERVSATASINDRMQKISPI